jgi:pimeloyl-ACP methyl ester carboxylesterase
MGEQNVEATRAALESREACERVVEAQASELLRADRETLVQAFHSLLCPVDAAVLTTDFANFVLRSVREGIGERRDGDVDDEIAFVTPWGFELSQIRIPVLLMHGEQDRMVPVSHGKWLASKIPNADARLLADDGHLTLSLRRIPEVHAWLLGKLKRIASGLLLLRSYQTVQRTGASRFAQDERRAPGAAGSRRRALRWTK